MPSKPEVRWGFCDKNWLCFAGAEGKSVGRDGSETVMVMGGKGELVLRRYVLENISNVTRYAYISIIAKNVAMITIFSMEFANGQDRALTSSLVLLPNSNDPSPLLIIHYSLLIDIRAMNKSIGTQ